MAELVRTRSAVVSVIASPHSLDALAPAGAYRCRIAPDEMMLVREPDAQEALFRDAGAARAGDPDALIVDATDGWVVWTLRGEEAAVCFARLSALRPSGGSAQGEVVAIPAKIVVEPGEIHLFVPAMVAEHARSQILARCPEIRQAASPQDWNAVGGSP